MLIAAQAGPPGAAAVWRDDTGGPLIFPERGGESSAGECFLSGSILGQKGQMCREKRNK